MEKITFQVITDSLECGREIEFSYKAKRYSITNSKGYWNFCCDTDNRIIEQICPFGDKETLIARVTSFCIEDIPIPSIFDEARYDVSSVSIL